MNFNYDFWDFPPYLRSAEERRFTASLPNITQDLTKYGPSAFYLQMEASRDL